MIASVPGSVFVLTRFFTRTDSPSLENAIARRRAPRKKWPSFRLQNHHLSAANPDLARQHDADLFFCPHDHEGRSAFGALVTRKQQFEADAVLAIIARSGTGLRKPPCAIPLIPLRHSRRCLDEAQQNPRKAASSYWEKAPNTRCSTGSTLTRAVKRLASDLGHMQFEARLDFAGATIARSGLLIHGLEQIIMSLRRHQAGAPPASPR